MTHASNLAYPVLAIHVPRIALRSSDPHFGAIGEFVRPIWGKLRLALILVLCVSCGRSWTSETVQPALQLGITDIARTSVPQVIALGDMYLPRRMKLANSVYFVVVSKDRLRFHVCLRHRSSSIANPSHWRVWIEDSEGERHLPEGIDRVDMSTNSRAFVPITAGGPHEPNGHPLQMITTFQGDGDYTFHEQDIFVSSMSELTLVMQRPGYEYRYRWRFGPSDESLRPEQEQTRTSLAAPKPAQEW
ncbi:MAG: hypothetical protein GY811_25115 [Myxococcales bacterium]|nr:hypothetical protein [Myxococcales bacterium]